MKKYLTPRLLLGAILLLAAILRLWNVTGVPPAASMDEASIGYNAYSLLITGTDEFGEFPFPSQRGYDDWRRSTYLLLTVPFVAIFNLQVVSIRLPAILLSLATVAATYQVVLLLMGKNKEFSFMAALWSSFLLAISPWHIYISRIGHETNAYLSFFVFGLLFFLKAVDRYKAIFLSALFFVLSVVSYYAGQVLVPVFAFGAFLIYRKELVIGILKDKKIKIGLLLVSLAVIPIIWAVFPIGALRMVRSGLASPLAVRR